jgi:hypothetical protein
MSDLFQAELRFLGITSSPAFVREPEGNGCAERFIRTLKEQVSVQLPRTEPPRHRRGLARRIPTRLCRGVIDAALRGSLLPSLISAPQGG